MPDTYFWVLSNRQDDRAVLYERDAVHPGGEAFIGGSAPAYVGRSSVVASLLQQGLIIEVPEPADGRKKPLIPDDVPESPAPALPGQVIKLGRTPDPELFPAAVMKQVEKQQAALPDQISVPAGTVVPPANTK
jgi:hypothetical protein